MRLALLIAIALSLPLGAAAQEKIDFDDKFRQLEEILPTPNEARTASGAPARGYWQQRADHRIEVEIDDRTQRLIGSERIRYENRSPDTLRYLWVQLENNLLTPDSDAMKTATAPSLDSMSLKALESMLARETFDGGVKIKRVVDEDGQPLDHTVVKTMMRIDLPKPLASGESLSFGIDWEYQINPSNLIGSRTGAEYFEEDGNYIYELAHWFPRMAAYTDVNGWQHKQFLGRGEFTLEFGDYDVAITVPSDHIVAATGVLQNPEQVMNSTQLERWDEAKRSDVPVMIVTPDEAKENEKTRAESKKTWRFRAENVRDFAFASSRKFAWDAVEHKVGTRPVMCMSFYPNEGEPLWSRYSTHAIIHTLDVYSRFTFEYPYPTAISVNGPVGGMEYPMICFNGPRPEKDGTYSKRTKYGLISVIIHEVGHNYFPMIVNSDERQWTWMDEGLNTFVQFLAEQEWERGYPSRRGEPWKIVPYMKSSNQVPIMTNSESILQFGSNAYAKPATALNILRETILGRELFDFAFKEYARRWQFKRPQPADFFRTMEDASGIDLDWFWRGWFYSTDHVDIAIADYRHYEFASLDPDIEKPIAKAERDAPRASKSETRNEKLPRRSDRFPELLDFYNRFDELDVTPADRRAFAKTMKAMTPRERALLATKRHFNVFDFENLGGLVMPLIIELTFEDGTRETHRIPAEIWRRSPERVSKMIVTKKKVLSVTLDPQRETADIDEANNHWPPRAKTSRFKLFKNRQRSGDNPMRSERKEEERTKKEAGR
jgi:peptidase M1-like protein